MKGIVLAGGTGSRLWPITHGLSKQLLPIYDKPLIFYPISTLMLAGIREILIITTADDQILFKKLLGNGTNFGIKLVYKVQENPNGIAEAFIIGDEFIANQDVALILGDNIFHGVGFGRQLQKISKVIGCQIFASKVINPERFGVIELDGEGNPLSIVEKPEFPKSHLAVTGLYFYDNQVTDIARSILPSSRGELEITDINLEYLKLNKLKVNVMDRGTAWFDTGTIDALYAAGTFVKVVEEQEGMKIGCLEEIAWRNGWLSDSELSERANTYGSSPYKEYLLNLLR